MEKVQLLAEVSETSLPVLAGVGQPAGRTLTVLVTSNVLAAKF
jgi:hypothetical protein